MQIKTGLNLLANHTPEVAFSNEVAFEYKGGVYKVHVNVITEQQETVYKLYFKNNIEDTGKSLMKLVRVRSEEGSFIWSCKPDYFSYMSKEIASVAGVAIDKVLQQEPHLSPRY